MKTYLDLERRYTEWEYWRAIQDLRLLRELWGYVDGVADGIGNETTAKGVNKS